MVAGEFQLLRARSREWRLQCPLCAAKGDAQGAFDEIAFDLVVDAMRRRLLHPQLREAILDEQLFNVVGPVFQDGVGILISDKLYNHLAWSDDFLRIAGSLAIVRRLFVDLTTIMLSYGLSWKPESLELFTNDAIFPMCDTLTFDVGSTSWVFSACSEGFEVLGVWQTPDGNAADAAGHRLQKTSQAFWTDAKLYLATSVPLDIRFDRFAKR
ncbi:unnamed protein product, partial [Prorocentrum cordatum]